ncbi:MAG TPA: dienelactone hydrolase family protein [Stellaceae bacterium]|nr:dienelactone hydrolase family protein [Stellaceae bacterium]
MSTITLDGASGHLAAAKKPRAGVLLLPTIFGVNKFVTDYCAALAERGLTTFAWDPYAGDKLPANFDEALARAKELRDGPSLDAMSIAVDFLMGESRLDKIGVIGFCLGGRYSVLLGARETRIEAAVAVYPSIEAPRRANQDEDAVIRAGEIACPVQLVMPGHDTVTSPDTYLRLKSALERRAADTSIALYPAAHHGFMHAPGPENEAASRHARPLVAAFLEAYLT